MTPVFLWSMYPRGLIEPQAQEGADPPLDPVHEVPPRGACAADPARYRSDTCHRGLIHGVTLARASGALPST